MKSFYFKIMLFRKKFTFKIFKIMLFRKIFSSKSCFLKLHVIRKKCAFYVLNWIKMWYFVCNIFFKICLLKLIFSSKSWFIDSSLIQNHAFYNNFSFKIMLFRKKFTFKIMLFRKIFFSKSCFFKIARNTQKLRILRVKLNQNVIFCVQQFL